MKYLLLIAAVFMVGCTALEQKGESYKKAAEMALNPQCVTVIYNRNSGEAGEVRSFAEMRCTGKLCDEVPACRETE